MKLIFLLFAVLFAAELKAQASFEVLPKIKDDTLFTTSGYPVVKNKEITIGTGSLPDGDFKFIRTHSNSLFTVRSSSGYNALSILPRSFAGQHFTVKKIEKRGNRRHGYMYFAKFGNGLVNYEIDIENAIVSGELQVPDQYKPKPATSAFSIADELAKLAKLYKEEVLTKEEYESARKKLLDRH